MAGDCSPTCLMKPHPRFCGKFQQSKSCVKSGCRTIAMMMVNSIGESRRTFPRQPTSSIRLTIQKPATARNTARTGPETSVHLTETCEADQPHLLIHVATTPAPESDVG